MFHSLSVQMNAFSGRPSVPEHLSAEARRWAVRPPSRQGERAQPPRKAHPAEWQDPEIGWGVVVAKDKQIPAIIQQLIAVRGDAPVFEYRRSSKDHLFFLWPRGRWRKVEVTTPKLGVGPDRLPLYLLILGSPEEVPWQLQYILSGARFVGRVDLDEQGLSNYFGALLEGFAFETRRTKRTCVWSVNAGQDDITQLMHDKIGSKLHEAFASDSEAPDQAVFLSGAEATNEALMATLHETAPSLIVTTSHGSVSYDEHDDEHVSFGALVDQREQTLNVDALVDSWQPRGAIWYAHACCSAGVDGLGSLADLFAPDSVNGRMLREASSRGARVATWAKRLLGARAPLRAFIGHVEPTFDWTLRRPGSEGAMASAIVEALYMNLLNEEPVGMALSSWYRPVGGIRSQYEAALQEFRRGADNLNDLLFYQLTAMDMSRTVILGDPTVALTRQ